VQGVPGSTTLRLPHSITRPAPSSITDRLIGLASWATPWRLAAVQVLVAAVMSTIMLAAPTPRPGFRGFAYDTNGPGAFRRIALWQEHLGGFGSWTDSLSIDPDLSVWGLRLCFAMLALLQITAVIASLRPREGEELRPIWHWMVGPALTMFTFLLYPPICSDVFFYATSGHIANQGGNPYLQPLRDFQSSLPLLRYNDWPFITSPYGPLWTSICRIVVGITGTSPVIATLGYRLLAILTAFGFMWVTYRAAQRLTDDRRLHVSALVIVGWQPVLLFESATGAHNDALIMMLALGGLLIVSSGRRGGIRAGLMVIALSALLKYVTLPMLGFAALWRLRELRQGTPSGASRHLPPPGGVSLRRIVLEWVLDAVAVGTVIAISFNPYWDGHRTLDSLFAQPMRGVSGSLWQIPHSILNGRTSGHTTQVVEDKLGYFTLVLLLPIMVITLYRLGRAMLTGKSERFFLTAQIAAWGVAAFSLATIPTDTHTWYVIWAIAPVALAFVAWQEHLFRNPPDGDAESPTIDHRLAVPLWFLLYLIWDFGNVVIYHTKVAG
jgi:hypothetical protein